MQHFDEIFKRRLFVEGFLIGHGKSGHVLDHFMEEVVPLIQQGKIRVREHRYEGLREAGKALADVHIGANTGKAVVVVARE